MNVELSVRYVKQVIGVKQNSRLQCTTDHILAVNKIFY